MVVPAKILLITSDDITNEQITTVHHTRELCRILHSESNASVFCTVLCCHEEHHGNWARYTDVLNSFHLQGLVGFDKAFKDETPQTAWISEYFLTYYLQSLHQVSNHAPFSHFVVLYPQISWKSLSLIKYVNKNGENIKVVLVCHDINHDEQQDEKEMKKFIKHYDIDSIFSLGQGIYTRNLAVLHPLEMKPEILCHMPHQEYLEKQKSPDYPAGGAIRLASFVCKNSNFDQIRQDWFRKFANVFKDIIIDYKHSAKKPPPQWIIYGISEEHLKTLHQDDEKLKTFMRRRQAVESVKELISAMKSSYMCIFPEKCHTYNPFVLAALGLLKPFIVSRESGIGETFRIVHNHRVDSFVLEDEHMGDEIQNMLSNMEDTLQKIKGASGSLEDQLFHSSVKKFTALFNIETNPQNSRLPVYPIKATYRMYNEPLQNTDCSTAPVRSNACVPVTQDVCLANASVPQIGQECTATVSRPEHVSNTNRTVGASESQDIALSSTACSEWTLGGHKDSQEESLNEEVRTEAGSTFENERQVHSCDIPDTVITLAYCSEEDEDEYTCEADTSYEYGLPREENQVEENQVNSSSGLANVTQEARDAFHSINTELKGVLRMIKRAQHSLQNSQYE